MSATFVNVGSPSETTPGLPAGLTAGDLLLLCAETQTEVPNPSGGSGPYTMLSPIGTRADTRSSVLTRVCGNPGTETAPTTFPGIAVNHAWGVIAAYTNAEVVDIFTLGAGFASNTSHAAPKFRTFQDDIRVVYVISWAADSATITLASPTNASLTGLTIRHESGTTNGNGGGIVIVDGLKATAGVVDELTWTQTTASAVAVTVILLQTKKTTTYSGVASLAGGGFAPNGTVVKIADTTQMDAVVTTTVSGGAGAFSAPVRFPAHTYVATADDGAGNRGSSEEDVP